MCPDEHLEALEDLEGLEGLEALAVLVDQETTHQTFFPLTSSLFLMEQT